MPRMIHYFQVSYEKEGELNGISRNETISTRTNFGQAVNDRNN